MRVLKHWSRLPIEVVGAHVCQCSRSILTMPSKTCFDWASPKVVRQSDLVISEGPFKHSIPFCSDLFSFILFHTIPPCPILSSHETLYDKRKSSCIMVQWISSARLMLTQGEDSTFFSKSTEQKLYHFDNKYFLCYPPLTEIYRGM